MSHVDLSRAGSGFGALAATLDLGNVMSTIALAASLVSL